MLKKHITQNFVPIKVKELLYQQRNVEKDLMKSMTNSVLD
jgi:hypothetical protein